MFKRDWGAIFAFGLITGGLFVLFSLVWVVGLNYCPNEPCNYQQTSQDQNTDTADSIWQIPNSLRGKFSYEAEPEYRESDPTRYEYYDLRAQERMAHATDWIAWLTFTTGVLSLLGFGALIYTLGLQRRANQITQEIGEAQARAYFGIEQIHMAIETGDGSQAGLKFVPHLRNSGQSPARVRFTHVSAMIYQRKREELDIPPNSRKSGYMPINANGILQLTSNALPWHDVTSAIANNHFIYLVCGVEYEDVFFRKGRERHVDDFALRGAFNGNLADPVAPVDSQPKITWHDAEVQIIHDTKSQSGL